MVHGILHVPGKAVQRRGQRGNSFGVCGSGDADMQLLIFSGLQKDFFSGGSNGFHQLYFNDPNLYFSVLWSRTGSVWKCGKKNSDPDCAGNMGRADDNLTFMVEKVSLRSSRMVLEKAYLQIISYFYLIIGFHKPTLSVE